MYMFFCPQLTTHHALHSLRVATGGGEGDDRGQRDEDELHVAVATLTIETCIMPTLVLFGCLFIPGN